jgi:hypothetical protein
MPLDSPAGGGIQRRCRQSLASAQAEAGVMPRAAHRVLDDQPLAERPAVMRAGRADREDLPAAPSQQHCVVANLTDKRRTIGELAFGNTVRQVRFVLTCVRHLILPQTRVVASTLR